MSNQLVVPSPQFRYLEPYKNRAYQYDTKHSNYFLSHYVNQLLNVVGNDVIVRGLEVTPQINPYRTGVSFVVNPGSLIQDLTYFELPSETVVQMDDINNFAGYYVIVYTSWRYIETVYNNPLKIEATLYNPKIQKIITEWDNYRNRIVLGMFKFEVDEDNLISLVSDEAGEIFFESLNITQNGDFDNNTFKLWTAINSRLQILASGGIEDTPCLHVSPLSNESQGIGQVLQTRAGYTYELSFNVRSEELTPFQVLILDGSALFNPSAPEVARYDTITSREWTKHSFRFSALSNNSTLLLLKKGESLEDTFDLDSIFCMEYLEIRKSTDLNQIKLIDGGLIYAMPNLPNPIAPPEPQPDEESDFDITLREWKHWTSLGRRNYPIPNYRKVEQNVDLVFYGSTKLRKNDYEINEGIGELVLNFDPGEDQPEITIISFGVDKVGQSLVHEWDLLTRTGVHTYPMPDTDPLVDPNNGNYYVFYGPDLLSRSDYRVDSNNNTITFDDALEEGSVPITILFFESKKVRSFYTREWILDVEKGQQDYFLSGNYPIKKEMWGFYWVFLGSTKLNPEDYTIDNTFFHLEFKPERAGDKLTVFHIGSFTSREVFDTEKHDFKNQEITVVPNQVKFKIPGYSDTKTQQDGMMVFYNTDILNQNDYYVDKDGTLDLTFLPTENAELSICMINSVGEKEAISHWYLRTKVGTVAYTLEETLKDPELGKYLVFYGSTLLKPEDYEIDIQTNQIILSGDLTQSQIGLNIYFMEYSAIPNMTISEWSFTTAENQTDYILEGNALGKDDDPGFYMVFFESSKLRSADYKIHGDVLRFLFNPEADVTVRVFYVGYREQLYMPELPPPPEVKIYTQHWEFKSIIDQNRYILEDIVEPENKSDIVFYDGELVNPVNYFINSSGQLILGFQPTNVNLDIDVTRIGADGFDNPIVTRWEIGVQPDQTTYSPSKPLKQTEEGVYLVFYGPTLLDRREYSIDIPNNTIILDDSLTLVDNSKLTILLFDGDVSEDVEVQEWNIKTAVGLPMYRAHGLKEPDKKGLYMVFYDYRKLSEEDYTISEDTFRLTSLPTRSGISITILYVGKKQ